MIAQLERSVVVGNVCLLVADCHAAGDLGAGHETIVAADICSSDTLRTISAHARAPYVLLSTKAQPVRMGYKAVERMVRVADETAAAMLYSDRMT